MRYTRNREADWTPFIVIPFIVLLVGFVVWLVYTDYSRKADCVDRGGFVQEYNCHTVLVPYSCGKDCTMYMLEESCDWRCAGLPAEDAR